MDKQFSRGPLAMRTHPNRIARRAADAALLLALAGWPAIGHARDYLADAHALLAKGDLKGAQIQLRNAVRTTPSSGEARSGLAKVDLYLGDPVAAEKEARAARDLGYQPGPTTALLAQTYMAQGHFDKLLTDFTVTGKDKAADSATLVARGYAELAKQKPVDAKGDFMKAAALNPHSPEPVLAMARMAMLSRDLPDADAKTEAALKLDPKSVQGRLQKAQLLRLSKDDSAALAVLNGVVADEPADLQARLDRATVLLAQNQDDKAKADLSYVLAAVPGSVMGTFLQADVLMRAKNFQGADNLLTQLGDRLAAIPRGYLMQAVVKQALGQTAQAEQAAAHAVAHSPGDLDALKVLARLQLAQHDPAAVVKTLSPVAGTPQADAETQDLLGAAYAMTGQDKDSIASLEKAAALQPKNAAIRAQIARVRMNAGDALGAMNDYKQALTLAPKQAQLAELMYFAALATGDMSKAADSVAFAQQAAGDVPIVQNLEGLLKLAQLDTQGARATFAKIVAEHPDFVPAQVNLARVDGIVGDTAGMDKHLAGMLATAPAGEPALSMYVARLMQEGRKDDARAALDRAQAAEPKNLALLGRRAAFALQTGDTPGAIALLDKHKDEVDKSVPLLALYAQAQIAAGQKDPSLLAGARDTLTKLVALDPGQVAERRRFALLMLDAGQAEQARNVIQAGLSRTPRDLGLLEDFCSIDLKTKGIDAALATADALASQNADFPPIRVLKGDMLMADKKYDDAAKAYQAALTATPATFFALRVAAAQQQGGHPDAALKTLADWNTAHPDEVDAAEQLAGLYINKHDYAAAAPVLQRIVDKNPRNAIALNNLAWVYQQQGDKRAPGLAREAYMLSPGAQTADTLGWILTSQGDAAHGVTLLRQAAADAANDPRLQYHLAVALKDTGKRDEAKQVLQTTLDKKPDFDEKADAEKLLTDLSKGA